MKTRTGRRAVDRLIQSELDTDRRLTVRELAEMDSSTNCQAPPQAAYCLLSCDKAYYKQEVCFLLHFLGQIVS